MNRLYPLERRLGGPRAGLDAVAKRKNPNSGYPARSLVTLLTELPWLLLNPFHAVFYLKDLVLLIYFHVKAQFLSFKDKSIYFPLTDDKTHLFQ